MKRERRYRHWEAHAGLYPFRAAVKETDLYILAKRPLAHQARDAIVNFRAQIEAYIEANPIFQTSLLPLPFDPLAPRIVQEMLAAGEKAGVGPMAGVAGAMAQFVGEALLHFSAEVIVENGGDIYIHTGSEKTVGIYAGPSPLSMQVGIRVPAECQPLGVCTSSASVGPSLSLGAADACCVVARSATLADAAATAIGNLVKDKEMIEEAIEAGRNIPGVEGIVIIAGDRLGAWGGYELVRL